jgi:hypothetical protein
VKIAKLKMAEKHLRSRGKSTGVETAPQDSESSDNNRELVCNIAEIETLGNNESNAQIEMQRGSEERQSPDDQVNNPVKSNDNMVMSSKQLERFMESVREGFDKFHTANTKLAETLNAKIQAEHFRLVEQIENNNNKRLSETLTKQFREENEK